jgi:hypothetical protein
MHVTMRCCCECTKYLAKTSPLGGTGASIARSIYRAMGSWDGIVSSGFECLYGLGTALLIVCLRRPLSPSIPMPAPIPRPIPTPPNLKTLRLPLPATAALYLRLSVSGVHRMRRRGSRVGSGPALEHQNRPHPSGGGDILSRPYAFWVLKNTRIA